MQTRTRSIGRAVGVVALSALLLSACGGEAGSSSGSDGKTVVLTADPTAVPAFVAEAEGFFGDTSVKVSTTGNDSVNASLLANKTQIAWMGPMEAADFTSKGDDFQYISTAGALNMWNAVVVRSDDADRYPTLESLKGKKLGISGYGGGDWATFTIFSDLFYGIDDARSAFKNVTADSGALLALLEKGDIDAAMLHSADAVAVRFGTKFKTVFSFTELAQEKLGQPLPITGAVARASWTKDHPDEVADVIAGLDKAVAWMQQNPDEFAEGGKYAKLAKDAGWNASPETLAGVQKLMALGEFTLTAKAYTQEWKDAIYKIVEAGKGVLVDTVPKEDAFLYRAE